jgi:hypothetical protein
LATVGVFKAEQLSRRGRIAVWLSFWLGIVMSLVANISAAPTLTLQPILVAGWPPVALLLAVELLAHGPRSRLHVETNLTTFKIEQAGTEPYLAVAETGTTAQVITLAGVSSHSEAAGEPTAQEVMWEHFQREHARGRTPTGAELDRIAGTNNYGRTVLRQWRNKGRIPPVGQDQRVRGGVG